MSLEERFEDVMKNSQAISTSNQELKSQNELLRKQFSESNCELMYFLTSKPTFKIGMRAT